MLNHFLYSALRAADLAHVIDSWVSAQVKGQPLEHYVVVIRYKDGDAFPPQSPCEYEGEGFCCDIG